MKKRWIKRILKKEKELTYSPLLKNKLPKRKKIINYKTNDPPKDRPVRIYADGIYDLFHMGHARSLLQAKTLFPSTYLIVGVCGDEITHRIKGKTVMNEKERAEAVAHCRYVDEVVLNSPWIVTPEFIEKYQIDFIVHGEDDAYDEDGNDCYQGIKDIGKFMTIKRTDGISTSDLILRIVKDYDGYVRRNLSRGFKGSDMNISFLKEYQIKIQESFKKMSITFPNVEDKSKEIFFDLKNFKDFTENLVVDFISKLGSKFLNIFSVFGGSITSPKPTPFIPNSVPKIDNVKPNE